MVELIGDADSSMNSDRSDSSSGSQLDESIESICKDISSENYHPFNPVEHGLDSKFRLTNFTELRGWGCKVPQGVLLKLLEGLKSSNALADSKLPNIQGQNPQIKMGY